MLMCYFTFILSRWTYADPTWARIAALVPVVIGCAEAGDQVADDILRDSVKELALSVKAVVRRLCLCGEGNAFNEAFGNVNDSITSNKNIVGLPGMVRKKGKLRLKYWS